MFYHNRLRYGGAERQICDLADELCDLGNQIMIISLTGKQDVKPKNPDIEIVDLGMEKTFLGLLKALYSCHFVVKKFAPNVVHSHMIHGNMFARLLRLFTKMPRLVCTAHNTNEGGKGRILAYKYTNFLADINTNVSDEAVEALSNLVR